MRPSQLIILAIIATPVVILARDAFDRRRAWPQVLLALGVLLAILANIAITLALGRTTPARVGANSQRQGSSQQCRPDETTLMLGLFHGQCGTAQGPLMCSADPSREAVGAHCERS